MESIASFLATRNGAQAYRQAESPVDNARLLTLKDIDTDRQKEARAFARQRRRLLLVEMGLGGTFALVVLGSGLAYRVRDWLAAITGQPVLLVGAYALLFLGAYGVLMAPVAYYGGFWLPHRYGLSTQTVRSWLADQGKGALLGLGVGLIVVEVIYQLLRLAPGMWWLVAGVFLLGLSVVLTTLAPLILVPLFYTLTPLADEELVGRLTCLAERAHARVRGVFTIDLSSKSRAANAMVMGLGKTRRIVLGDTLYEEYTADEIEVILAHELGHQVGHDVWWGLAFQSGLTLAGLYAAHVVLDWAVDVLGLAGVDDVAGLPLLALVMGGFMAVTVPLGNAFSRWRESLADEYALRLTGKPEGFVSVMVRLANQNLADVEPERWVELLLHSHPAIGRRIQQAQSFAGQG
jgi:STE24 endopeptidase